MQTIKERVDASFETLKKEFGYKAKLQAPRILKVSISSATGTKMKQDKHKNDFIIDRISKIAGQKPVTRKAKQSVAAFKIRQGDPIGVMVTLRGERMYAFLDKLLAVALPRTKDFRGLKREAVDSMGNMTIGIKEHTIFPEIKDEELKDVFGFAITVVTTAKTKKEAMKFFELLEIPFKRD